MQKLHRERVVDLGAQASHGHLDHVGVGIEVHVPHLFGKGRARKHLAALAKEQGEERELFCREIEALTRAIGLAARKIDFKVGETELCGEAVAGSSAATQERDHASEQLGKGEGLN